MIRRSLVFTSEREVELREECLPPPASGEMLVQTVLSSISAGTEMLVYRDQAPAGLKADETIPCLSGDLTYPVKYGYSAVGNVIQLGADVKSEWAGKLVFAFHPHESLFIARPDELLIIPSDISPEEALFLANMETAINLVMDGRPVIGEKVLVFGQGIVGLLVTSLLARFPLAKLVTLDCYPLRRQASREVGAGVSLDPMSKEIVSTLRSELEDELGQSYADLTYELSGDPTALDSAILATGFSGRIVIGSWYGSKRSYTDLGGYFHRSRLRLISSQVSSIAPELTGRWSKSRRIHLAWNMIKETRPSTFTTHRFPFLQAAKAYELLDQQPGEAIQVILTY